MNFNKIISSNRPYIIAELGINHNGKIKLAKKMVKIAKKIGADCVKFQFFNAEKLISKNAPKAPYQKVNKKNTQLEIIKKCEINLKELKQLKSFCKNIKIDFLCTPFDLESLNILINIGIKSIKISSCNLTNIPFLERVAKSKLPVFLSTGMGTLDEVKDAFKILKKNKLIIFQCTSNYPSLISESNLAVLDVYKKLFRIPLGYSDHTKENTSALVALGMGVKVFEKHFTLSNKLKGIDQKASLNTKDFENYIKAIKQGYQSIGVSKKAPSVAEKKVSISLRKSLVGAKDIKIGEKLNLKMVEFKRPGNGIPTKFLKKYIGKTIKKKVLRDSLLKKNQFYL